MEKNLPPLKGEVARRAGGVRRPSPAEGESPGFLRIRAAFPLPAEAFQGKAGTPQSRLRRASSPCRGALERAYFRQLTPATPLIHRCGGPPSPWGKVGEKASPARRTAGGEGFWGRFRFQNLHILFFLTFDFSPKISTDHRGALGKSARADSERFCFQARD